MTQLAGAAGELRGTVTITRKATGAVETYEIVGRVSPEQAKQLEQAASAPQAAPNEAE